MTPRTYPVLSAAQAHRAARAVAMNKGPYLGPVLQFDDDRDAQAFEILVTYYRELENIERESHNEKAFTLWGVIIAVVVVTLLGVLYP